MHLRLCELYCEACVVHGCLTNSAILAWVMSLDSESTRMPIDVDFSKNYLGDRGVAALCVVLSVMTQIERANFSSMDLQLEGVKAICSTVATHPNISQLDLRGNELFASSAKAILELVRSTPRVMRCLFDPEDVPPRYAQRIYEYVGRNIAIRYPCTWASAAVEPSIIEEDDLTAAAAHVNDESLSPFQTVLLSELDGPCGEALVECFNACGVFACQFFVDFGPSAVSFLQSVHREYFPDELRDGRLMPRPLFAKLVLTHEMDRLHHHGDLSEELLLPKQLAAAKVLIHELGPQSDLEPVLELVCHIRSTLSMRSPSAEYTEALLHEAAVMRDKLVAELNVSRRLKLLYEKIRYFHLDTESGGMAREVLARYCGCQPPLRVSRAVVMTEVLRLSRAEYCPRRRELLAEFYNACPAPLFELFFAALVARALIGDSASSRVFPVLLELHQTTEWISLIVEHFGSEQQLRQLLIQWAAWRTYRAHLQNVAARAE